MKSDQSKTKVELIQELQSLQKRISTQDITELTGVEKKLWESEKKYNTLFEESRDAIFISSLDGSSFDFNQSAEELLGYSREELLSLSMEDLYARKEDRLQFRKIIESRGYVKDYELQLRKKDGSVIDCLDSATVRRDMDGNIIGYQGIIRDITERKRAGEELQETNAFLRNILESSTSVSIISTDWEGNILYWNQGAEKIFGYKSEEIVGHQKIGIIYPDDEEETLKIVKDMRSFIQKNKKGISCEIVEVTKDGRKLWAHLTLSPRLNESGEVIGILGIGEDITERRIAEEALKESETKYKEIATSIPGVVYQFIVKKDGSYSFSYVDESCEKFFQHKAKAVVADPNLIFNMVPPDELQSFIDSIEESAKTLNEWRHDFRVVLPDGQERWFEGRSVPHLLPSGEPFWNGVVTDITERKQAEEVEDAIYRISEETHSAQNLKSLFSLIHDIVGELIHTKNFYIALYDPDTEMINFPYFVDEYDENPGRKKPGTGLTKYVIRTGRPLLASPEVYEELVKKGEVESIGTQSIDWLGVPLKTEDKTIGVIAVQSYTEDIRFGEEEKNILTFVSEQIAMTIERKRAEEELQVSEKKYRQLIENAYEAIYIAQDGMLVFANPMVNHIMGYSNEELFSNPFTDFIHPDDQKLVYENYVKRLKGEKVLDHYNFRIIDKKSGIKWLSIRSINIEWDGKPATLNFSSNITRQLRAENALRESEKKFRSVVESSPMGMHMYHLESKGRLVFTGANKAADQILGVDNNQFIGKTIEEAFPPLAATELPNRYRRIAAQGESWSTEQVIYEDEKISGVFEVYAFQTEPDKMVAMFNDITKRKQADEEIARFSRIFENSLNEIYLFNETTLNFIQVNRAAQNNLGYTMEELQKRTPLDIKPEFTDESFAELVAPLRKGDREEVVFKTVHKRKNQSLYDVEVHLQLLKHEHEALFAAIVLDITKRKQREEMLVQSENSFRGLYDNATDAIYIQDREGRFLDVNQAVVNMYGYPKEFFIGKTPEPLSAPGKNDLKKVAMYIEKAFKGEPQKFEFWGKRKNGEIFPKFVRLKKSVYFGQEVVIAFAMDITERKQNEEEITMLAHALRSINECVSITDLQNRILFVNQSFVDTYGYREDELIGEKINIVRSPNNPPGKVENILSETIRGRWSGEIINRRKDGTDFPIQISTTAIRDADNQVIALIGVADDITERKQAEEEISFLANALKSISECVSITDEKDRLLFVNEAFLKTYGYTREEVVGHLIQEIVGSKQNPPEVAKEILPATILGGWQGELINRRKDKSEFPISLSTTPVRNDHGKIVALIGVAEDITERKLAEEALKVSEKKYRNAVENASDLIFINDIYGNFTFINTVSEEITEYSKSELLEMNYAEITHPDDKEKTWELYEEQFKTRSKEIKFENRFVTKSGKIKWLWVHSTLLMEGDSVVGWQNIGRDITERKQAEEKLHYSEERYKSILENIEEGYYEVDLNGNFIFFNDSICRMLNYSRDELMGMNNRQYMDSESADRVYQAFNKVFKTGKSSTTIDFKIKRKEGNINAGEISISLLKDRNNQSIGFRGIVRDITERKQAEEELKQKMEQINRANKLMVGRELKMIELKGEVNELLVKTGQSKKYSTPNEKT